MEHVIGVGIDVVDVERVRRAFQRHGQRFLRKVFTPREARRAAGRRGAERLAARFAAKEATLKAMGTGLFPGARWTDVEVVRGPLGAPGIRLHGRVAEKASELGVTGFLVSLTHERTVAIAQVMALAPRPREDGTSR